MRKLLGVSTVVAVGVPEIALALTFPQVIGLFHIAVGLILTFIVLFFVAVFSVYVARFNTWPSYRDNMIRAMEWAVVMLFVLIILLSIVNAIQHHGDITLPVIAFLIIIVVAFIVVRIIATSRKPPVRPQRPQQGPPPPGRR
ncbi:hypothetical protein HY414_00720 [Candidatus Kaiserbacteria bacterium]|nr:hypothetical protein [Candidatus Kaiserbacteria bacterium]